MSLPPTFTPRALALLLALGLTAAASGATAQITLTPPPVPEADGPAETGTDMATEEATDEATTPPGLPETPPPLPETPVTPPPLPPQPDYFVDQNGTPGGPFKLGELQALVAAGSLGPTTLAWTSGMEGWEPAGQVEALAPLFAGPAPVSPDPGGVAVTDPAAFVVGRWQQQGMIPLEGLGMGAARLTTDYMAGGRFTLVGTVDTMINGQPAQIAVSSQGTYSVAPGQNGAFDLTARGAVTMSVPALGIPPSTEQVEETTSYVIVDPDTIRDVETGEIIRRM